MKGQLTPSGLLPDDSGVTNVTSNSGDTAGMQEFVVNDNESDDIIDDGDDGEEHEFEIIDQVESEEGEADEQDRQALLKERNDDIDDGSTSEEDLADSELHALLEKGIDQETLRKDDGSAPIIKQKIVLKEFESDPFDILPEGWVCVTHNCGMPVYLHKETRVCTMARPYSLGSASARAHDIPLSAIPCLQYRRQLDKESGNSKPGKEGDVFRDTTPMEVSHGTGNISVDVHPHSQAVKATTAGHTVSLCPATTDPKPSPRKLWVVSQESFQKCPLESQQEALHTGTAEFSTIDDQVKLFKDSTVTGNLGFPQSPEGDNIAVSFDSSSLDSSCLEVHGERPAHALGCNSRTVLPDALPAEPREVSSSSPFTATLTTSTCESSDPCVTLTLNPREEPDCLEEGEIVEDVNIVLPESGSPQTMPSQSGMPSCEQKANIDVTTCSSNCAGHVVREEVTSSSEPSELVTSSSNSLATIKRKIESLKNKRAGKLRKLDGGGAVAWPTDNNIAVKPLGIAEASNVAGHASANEKLKMHAAEVKIKSAEERAKESLLDSHTVHSYCSQLFQFRTLEVKKYRSWRERRRHIEERSRRNRPELPPSTKLITCPIPGNLRCEDGGENGKKREFILNPTGKSYLCILHEYMQRTLKIQPLYVFKELENSKTPYGATVTISNIEYGTGYASSKKVAKQEAAKETLRVLIPDLFKKISDQEIKTNISDLSFFDDIKVTDPRVNELGNKVGQPSPFQLLLECLRRNFGMGNTQCEVSTKPLKNQKCEFTINVGKHSAMVVAKNKREGKQLAAQAILAKLHPHVPSWGSLLRLYGTSVEKPAQKPEDMNDIKSHAPNHSVLDSLRQEMRKLHQQKEAIQPKGKIIISSKNLPSKMSGVDL
ncbi:unnamed protein product [Candidula unifasciata]|uniref:DRBM domain-containing protein n=1 Tax=Candidula unifasciata TaxID=100452 RepID=A0A8S3ZRD1_9EUPU|nr:unnamed protein product [Candidula unifasciata]